MTSPSDDREPFDHGVETAVVTGATGTVGSWVGDRLARNGCEVIGVDLEAPDVAKSFAILSEKRIHEAPKIAYGMAIRSAD